MAGWERVPPIQERPTFRLFSLNGFPQSGSQSVTDVFPSQSSKVVELVGGGSVINGAYPFLVYSIFHSLSEA